MILTIVIWAILLAPPFIIIKRIIDRYRENQYWLEEQRKEEEYLDNVRAIREMLEKQEQQKINKDE